MRSCSSASIGALVVGGMLFACMNDFDKFEESGLIPSTEAGTDASDSGSVTPPVDASTTPDASSTVDAGPCRDTPATCVSDRGTCRDACDATSETCENACSGGNQFQCRSQCRRTRDECRSTCNDTCRTCAGSCPTDDCR